jgi:tetratricopeptide (TPR) repeat protein
MKKLTPVQKGQVILYFLHRTTLKNYQPSATELQKALDQGDYNCVSSTLLFNILCARFNVRTTGIEVPTHVYSAVLDSHPRKKIYEVQTTTPQGFWVTDQTYLKHNEFISHPHLQTWKGKRHVAEVALIAVIYYNRGIDWIRKEDYIQALPFYRRAFRLDPHFPNLTSLLAELYTGVGNQFFEKDDYSKAIQMYREGLSFFAQRKDHSDPLPLSENLTAAFINQANLAMNQKKWPQALALLQQAQNLGFFRQTILHNRKAMYYAWGQDRIDQKNWHEALSVYRNARKEFPQEKGFHQNLSWTYAKIGEELFKGHQFKRAKEWYALAYRETGEPNFMKVKKWLEKV